MNCTQIRARVEKVKVLGWNKSNEVHKCIDYIQDDIFVIFYQSLSDLCIEALIGYKKWCDKEIFQGMQNFQDMEGLVNVFVEIHVEFQGMEIYLGYGNYPGNESLTSYTTLYNHS